MDSLAFFDEDNRRRFHLVAKAMIAAIVRVGGAPGLGALACTSLQYHTFDVLNRTSPCNIPMTCKLHMEKPSIGHGKPRFLLVPADRKRAPPDPNEPTCCGWDCKRISASSCGLHSEVVEVDAEHCSGIFFIAKCSWQIPIWAFRRNAPGANHFLEPVCSMVTWVVAERKCRKVPIVPHTPGNSCTNTFLNIVFWTRFRAVCGSSLKTRPLNGSKINCLLLCNFPIRRRRIHGRSLAAQRCTQCDIGPYQSNVGPF